MKSMGCVVSNSISKKPWQPQTSSIRQDDRLPSNGPGGTLGDTRFVSQQDLCFYKLLLNLCVALAVGMVIFTYLAYFACKSCGRKHASTRPLLFVSQCGGRYHSAVDCSTLKQSRGIKQYPACKVCASGVKLDQDPSVFPGHKEGARKFQSLTCPICVPCKDC